MTDVIETSSPDLLRLTTCPQCEYALEGLPEEGVCPECGRVYDKSIVIVRCDGVAAQKFNPHVLLVIALAIGAVIAGMVLFSPIALRFGAQIIVMLAFVAVICFMNWLDRVLSPRGGAWLLWVTPQGMGVQRDFDPDSFFARARKWTLMIWWPLYAGASMLPLIMMGLWIFPLVVAGVVFILMLLFQRMLTPKFAVAPSGPQPGLVGWSGITEIRMKRFKPERHRLTATSKHWIMNLPVVIVSFRASDEYAAALRERIEQWGQQKVSDMKGTW